MASRCCVPGGAGRRLGLSEGSRTKLSGTRIPGVQELTSSGARDPKSKRLEGLEPEKAGQGDKMREPS